MEIAPGIWIWPDSTYRWGGEEHECDCEMQDNLRRHYLLARIPQHYWSLGEGDWYGDPAALAAAQDYLEHWKDWKRYGVGLQFYSPTQGTGKTMLACLISKALIRKRVRVRFVSFLDAVRLFEQPYEERKPIEELLRNSPVLILDEVGKAISPAQRELFAVHFEALIRYRTDGNAVTIVTTNMTPEVLDEQYSRIYSLLKPKQEYIFVKGTDARREVDWDLTYKHLIKTGESRPLT